MRSSCLERRVCFDHAVEHRLGWKGAGSQSSTKCFSFVFSNASLQNTAQSQLYPVDIDRRKKGHPPPSLPCKRTRISPWEFRKHYKLAEVATAKPETKGDGLLTGGTVGARSRWWQRKWVTF